MSHTNYQSLSTGFWRAASAARSFCRRSFSAARPTQVVIRHVGSDDSWKLPVAFDASGAALGEWTIPKQAKLGAYSVDLVRANGDSVGNRPGALRVEAFRAPRMRGAA